MEDEKNTRGAEPKKNATSETKSSYFPSDLTSILSSPSAFTSMAPSSFSLALVEEAGSTPYEVVHKQQVEIREAIIKLRERMAEEAKAHGQAKVLAKQN